MRPNQLIIKVESGATMVDSFIGQLIKKNRDHAAGLYTSRTELYRFMRNKYKKQHI